MNTYHILVPRGGTLFIEQLDGLKKSLISVLGGDRSYHIVSARFFLSDIRNQYDVLITSELYREFFAHVSVSIVEQAPSCGSKVALLCKFSNCQDQDFLFQPLRVMAKEAATSCYEQTETLFNRYAEYLKEQGLNMSTHLVRTWIYVADIDHDYTDVVRARNDVFARHGLTAQTHFVASTGIGGVTEQAGAKVAIDFLTYPGIMEEDKRYLTAPEYLNPTNEYGVAFERGTRISTPSGTIFYISGTASIDKHGEVLWLGDVKKQFERIVENMEALLKSGGSDLSRVDYLIVYLRDPADYEWAAHSIPRVFDRTPLLVVHAKVCRPEWLIEIEAVAH